MNPGLDPKLRFDDSGRADRLPELLETARIRALTVDEAQILAEALRTHQPWLEWAGKREAKGFSVDPVALYIHERVSTEPSAWADVFELPPRLSAPDYAAMQHGRGLNRTFAHQYHCAVQ